MSERFSIEERLSYRGNHLSRLAEELLTGRPIEPDYAIAILDIPTMAIIPDPEMDPEGWEIGNKPVYHIRIGMNIWEDVRALKNPVHPKELLRVICRR